jgi:hypothetical protein
MPSLRERQRRFADAVSARGASEPMPCRMAIYWHNIRRNYRNALGSTYPVVRALVGPALFDAAVDAFVATHPSTCGDLNDYGDRFGAFVGDYPPARPLPYLPDIARLEWAIDAVHRARDATTTPDEVMSAFARVRPDKLAAQHLSLAPACRLVASRFPILRIWRANQPDYAGERHVELDEGGDCVLIRRGAIGIPLETLDDGEYAFLSSLAAGAALGDAVDRATRADPVFDLAATLRKHIASSTIHGTEDMEVSGSAHVRDQWTTTTREDAR